MVFRLSLAILFSLLFHFWLLKMSSWLKVPQIQITTAEQSVELSFALKQNAPLEPALEKKQTPIHPLQASEPDSASEASIETPEAKGIQQAYVLQEQQPPVYPLIARQRGLEGRVLLNVNISEAGDVVQIEILRSSGFALLDQAAVEGVRKWKYAPAKKNNQPVSSWLEVPVLFKLE